MASVQTTEGLTQPLSGKQLWFQKYSLRKTITAWLFILPILAIYILVVVGPAFFGVYYALTDWSGFGPAEFVGLDNFEKLLFHDKKFRAAFGHNVIWMLFFMTIPVALALIAASLLSKLKKGSMLLRVALFIPFVLPSVVTAFIWRVLLNPDKGIGGLLANIGVPGLDYALLGNTKTALLTIAFVDNWHWWGFLMILFLTAMQNIPGVLYDAAKIDGANWWNEFLHVTLPGIRPTLIFMLMMTAIWSFLAFDYVWILTQGGPAGSSEVLGTYLLKQAFFRFEAGYGAAIGLSISFLAGLVILAFIFLRRRGWEI